MNKRTPDQMTFTDAQLLELSDIPLLKQWYHILTEDELKIPSEKYFTYPSAVSSLICQTPSVLSPASSSSEHTRPEQALQELNQHPSPCNELKDDHLPSCPLNSPIHHDKTASLEHTH